MRAKLEAPIEAADMTAVVLMIVETTSWGLVGGTTIRRRKELARGYPSCPPTEPQRLGRFTPPERESPAITATGIIDSDGFRERYEEELLWPFFRNTGR